MEQSEYQKESREVAEEVRRILLVRLASFENSTIKTAKDATESRNLRRGRLPKGERAILRAQFLATIREHPTMVDSPGVLASSLGMSESTVRRWVSEEMEKYARLSRRRDAE
jgi:DNA-binding transcriptional regulator YiaG